MGGINWSELFPTKTSAVIFVSYMLLFVNQGMENLRLYKFVFKYHVTT